MLNKHIFVKFFHADVGYYIVVILVKLLTLTVIEYKQYVT